VKFKAPAQPACGYGPDTLSTWLFFVVWIFFMVSTTFNPGKPSQVELRKPAVIRRRRQKRKQIGCGD